MRIGLAFDLKSDFRVDGAAPEDRLEEYDSDQTVSAIETVLRGLGHQTVRLGGGRRFLEAVLTAPPDLVFNIAEGYGTRSREAHVPSVLEMLGIPFTHSDPLTAAVTLDKSVAKRIASSGGVPTPQWCVLRTLSDLAGVDLRFPVIAKPLNEGSSMGIRRASRVASIHALREQVEPMLSGYGQPVLVEEFLSGVEMTVGILGNGSAAQVIGAMEIAPRVDRPHEFVYSLEVKRNYETLVEYHVPPRVDASTLKTVHDVALAAYRELECRDVSRVDIRCDAEGRPNFIEVNPLPGLNPVTGDLVILSRRSGLNYESLIAGIVDAALARYARP